MPRAAQLVEQLAGMNASSSNDQGMKGVCRSSARPVRPDMLLAMREVEADRRG